MKTWYKRTLAVLLAASMLFPLATEGVNVWAAESSETSEEALVEGIELQTLVEEDSQLEVEQDIYEEELQNQLMQSESEEVEEQGEPINKDNVPDAVGYDEAILKNHIERMFEEEKDNLNCVIFKNADETRTQYLFDYPVKYEDYFGNIKDNSLEIVETKDGEIRFESEGGVSRTRFPETLEDGIQLKGEDVSLTLVPQMPVSLLIGEAVQTRFINSTYEMGGGEASRIDEETISYEYDSQTTIEYSLTYTGFKEDIVVSEYTG